MILTLGSPILPAERYPYDASSPANPTGLRIGVDVACWGNMRGYGRFTRELLRAMVEQAPDDQFICFLDHAAKPEFDLESPNVRLSTVRLSHPPALAAAAGGNRWIRDLLRLTRAVARERLDVFFFPSVYTYFPLPPGLPALTTIHDTIPESYPELTLPRRRDQLFWRLKRAAALRQSRLVLTVSDYAAGRIADVLSVAPESIRVASEASSSIYRPSRSEDVVKAAKRLGLEDGARWFIYVGGFNPHKRVESLVRAHGRLVRDSPADPPLLLLVGDAGRDVFYQNLHGIKDAIHESGTENLVRWTGYLPDGELRHLLSGAVALVLPSCAEGFGLPAVEAAACGTAIVATTESPLPTLLAGGGRFVDPRDDSALFEAMRFLLENEPERRRLGLVARERAMRLDWKEPARISLRALREIAG